MKFNKAYFQPLQEEKDLKEESVIRDNSDPDAEMLEMRDAAINETESLRKKITGVGAPPKTYPPTKSKGRKTTRKKIPGKKKKNEETEMIDEAPLNLGKIEFPSSKDTIAIQRKLKGDAPEILKQYRKLVKRLETSAATSISPKEIVYIRTQPTEEYRKRTGLGDAHHIHMRPIQGNINSALSSLGKEVIYHKGSSETIYNTVLAIKESAAEDRPLQRGTSRKQKQMARDQADKRVSALKASGKFKKSPKRKKKNEEEEIEEAAKAKEIKAILKKFPSEAKRVRGGGSLSDKKNVVLYKALDDYFHKKEPKGMRAAGDVYSYLEDAIDDVYSGDFKSFESFVNEGTWGLPDKTAKIKKLEKLMKKKFPVGVNDYNDPEGTKDGVESKLSGIVGDDELYDDLEMLRRKKGPKADARPVIKKWLKKNDAAGWGNLPKDVVKIWDKLAEATTINEAIMVNFNTGVHSAQERWGRVHLRDLVVKFKKAKVKHETDNAYYVAFDVKSYNDSPLADKMSIGEIIADIQKNNGEIDFSERDSMGRIKRMEQHKEERSWKSYLSSTTNNNTINEVYMVNTQKQKDGSFKWILQSVEHKKTTVLDTGTESSRAKADRAGKNAKKKLKETSTDEENHLTKKFSHENLPINKDEETETETKEPTRYRTKYTNGRKSIVKEEEMIREYIANLKEAVDKDTVRELVLYITNDAQLYRQRTQPIIKNLSKKVGNATYDGLKATKLFMYLVKDGIKKYEKEFATPGWGKAINKETKQLIAIDLLDYYTAEIGESYEKV